MRENIAIKALIASDIWMLKKRKRQLQQPSSMHLIRRKTGGGASGVKIEKLNMR